MADRTDLECPCMPGTITPLPLWEDHEKQAREERAERESATPESLVVRYGYMRHIAELPYRESQRPGCGTKLVARTARGVELAELVTTTCPNGGCGSSVNRKEMLAYIDRSGGKSYPFFTEGRVLRIATQDDLDEQVRLDSEKPRIVKFAKRTIDQLGLDMRLVEVELLLGGDRIIFHYTAEQWIDFRELVRILAGDLQTRIEMHQVNARDEARITADYEKCGQHCCCRQFLKVLKPVSLRSAKVQKATLDPSKISGRCGRLMCCLRYEDQTYAELKKKLPNKQTPVRTASGVGVVTDTQILTQLVVVKLLDSHSIAAFPLEEVEILGKEELAAWRESQARPSERDERRGEGGEDRRSRRGRRRDGGGGQDPSGRSGDGSRRGGEQRQGEEAAEAPSPPSSAEPGSVGEAGVSDGAPAEGSAGEEGEAPTKRRRRRRGGRRRGGSKGDGGDGGEGGASAGGSTSDAGRDASESGGGGGVGDASATGGESGDPSGGAGAGDGESRGRRRRRGRRGRRRRNDGDGSGGPGNSGGGEGGGGDSGGGAGGSDDG